MNLDFAFNWQMLHLAPLAPQLWGESEFQSPPELGDLGGEKDLCVHRRALPCSYPIPQTPEIDFRAGFGGLPRMVQGIR
jgi:hypothetical protein